jgi:hypothetical protein
VATAAENRLNLRHSARVYELLLAAAPHLSKNLPTHLPSRGCKIARLQSGCKKEQVRALRQNNPKRERYMKTVIVALVASAAILAVSVSANAGGGAHNRCGSTWETCAARGKASPVAAQQPAQQYLQQKSKKGGSR